MKKIFALLLLISSSAFADAGWDNGFYIKSDDGQFKMNLGGRLQFLELAQKRSETRRAPGARATLGANNFSDTFQIRRARIQTTGTLYEKLDWFTIVNVGTAQGTANPNTLWITGATYNFSPAFQLSGGMVQLPLDRMGENSSVWLLGVEAALTNTQEDGNKGTNIARDSLSMPFDLGLRVDGQIGRFSYALATANGNGFNNVNINNELSYGSMFKIDILGGGVPFGKEGDFGRSEKPQLSLNFGTGFEDEDAADENVAGLTRLWSWLASGGWAFRYNGFSLNNEFYYRLIKTNIVSALEDTNRDRKLRDVGYYANAGYFFIPKKLEGMLTAAQIFREGADNNANEFGGGLNWYMLGDGKVKTQLDYTNVLDYDELPGLNNAVYHRVRLMFSMFL